MEYKDQFLGLHYFVTKIIRILRHPESSSHLNSGRFPRLSAFSINQIFWGSFHLKLSFWLLCNRKFHDVLGNYKSNLSSPSLRGLHQHNIANKEKIGFCLLTMTNATNISQSLKKNILQTTGWVFASGIKPIGLSWSALPAPWQSSSRWPSLVSILKKRSCAV